MLANRSATTSPQSRHASVSSLPLVGRYLIKPSSLQSKLESFKMTPGEDKSRRATSFSDSTEAYVDAKCTYSVTGQLSTKPNKCVAKTTVSQGDSMAVTDVRSGTSRLLVSALEDIWEKYGLGDALPRHLIELGCGDGRLLIDVAKAIHGCTCTGIDSDCGLIDQACEEVKRCSLESRCKFRVGNGIASDVSSATAVLLSLPAESLNVMLEDILLKGCLQTGSLIFRVGDSLPASPYIREILRFLGGHNGKQCLICYALQDAKVVRKQRKEAVLLLQSCARRYFSQCIVRMRLEEDSLTSLQGMARKYNAQLALLALLAWASRSPLVVGSILSRWSHIVSTCLCSFHATQIARNRLRCPKGTSRLIVVQPHRIFFAKSSIAGRFASGRTVASTIHDLRNGIVTPQEIPTISLIRRGGRLLTLNHRRLYAFQQALPEGAEIEAWLLESETYISRPIPADCRGNRSVYIDHDAVG